MSRDDPWTPTRELPVKHKRVWFLLCLFSQHSKPYKRWLPQHSEKLQDVAKGLGESHKRQRGAYKVTGALLKGNKQTLSVLKEEKEDQMRCQRMLIWLFFLGKRLGTHNNNPASLSTIGVPLKIVSFSPPSRWLHHVNHSTCTENINSIDHATEVSLFQQQTEHNCISLKAPPNLCSFITFPFLVLTHMNHKGALLLHRRIKWHLSAHSAWSRGERGICSSENASRMPSKQMEWSPGWFVLC